MTRAFSPIPTISAFAFVVAVFDYMDADDLSPVMAKEYAVGFVAWGWAPKTQGWERLCFLTDTEASAREIAHEHYLSVMRELGAEDNEIDLIEHTLEPDEE